MKLVLLFVLFFNLNIFADDGLTIVAIGEANLEREKLLLQGPFMDGNLSPNAKKSANEVMSILKNDFSFYQKLFEVLDIKKASGNVSSLRFEALKLRSIKHLFQISFKQSSSSIIYKAQAYDVNTGEKVEELTGSYNVNSTRRTAHKIADGLYQAIVGKKSIFNSKVIFVSDRNGTRKKPVKELYSMDFDGRNKKQLTFHGGTVISPALSLDGNRVLYSLISKGKKRNINLRLLDIRTGKSNLISNRKGINSGAIFMPGEEDIALTLSHSGNAELYIMNLRSKKLKRLTRHFSPDVDPSISYDGSLMTFLSGRAGKAMIYTMKPNGLEQKVKRISYVGKFNATPRFSPDGKFIAFSSWLDNRFDIFRINANGSGLSRLTKDFGSNEDPTYSLDGEFIAFSSQRVISRKKADQNIYIMGHDGEIVGQITKNFGNCITPRWSK
jgi:TolB protein